MSRESVMYEYLARRSLTVLEFNRMATCKAWKAYEEDRLMRNAAAIIAMEQQAGGQ